MALRLLAWTSENNGTFIIRLGKIVEEAGLGRIIRSSELDMLNLKYILDVQVKKSRR